MPEKYDAAKRVVKNGTKIYNKLDSKKQKFETAQDKTEKAGMFLLGAGALIGFIGIAPLDNEFANITFKTLSEFNKTAAGIGFGMMGVGAITEGVSYACGSVVNKVKSTMDYVKTAVNNATCHIKSSDSIRLLNVELMAQDKVDAIINGINEHNETAVAEDKIDLLTGNLLMPGEKLEEVSYGQAIKERETLDYFKSALTQQGVIENQQNFENVPEE